MSSHSGHGNVTVLLQQIASGDPAAKEELFTLLYPELRKLAEAELRRESPGHTLQPTALVNEAAMRLVDSKLLAESANRLSFFAAASRAMHAVLVDHARRRAASKRPTGDKRVRHPLDEAVEFFEQSQRLELVDLDDALQKLQTLNSRQHDIVTLHLFGGLRFGEIADYLQVSLSTVEKDWRFARAWLRQTLDEELS